MLSVLLMMLVLSALAFRSNIMFFQSGAHFRMTAHLLSFSAVLSIF